MKHPAFAEIFTKARQAVSFYYSANRYSIFFWKLNRLY